MLFCACALPAKNMKERENVTKNAINIPTFILYLLCRAVFIFVLFKVKTSFNDDSVKDYFLYALIAAGSMIKLLKHINPSFDKT